MTAGVPTRRKNSWPLERIERMRKLAAAGYPYADVAYQMGVNPMTLWTQAKRHGIKFQRKGQAPRRFARPKPQPAPTPAVDPLARHFAGVKARLSRWG